MGMVRTVASWGLEVGWKTQSKWRSMMEKLQYAALRKCTEACLGSRREAVRKVAAVGDVEVFARVTSGRFLARTMYEPVRAGVVEASDELIVGKGTLSVGDRC